MPVERQPNAQIIRVIGARLAIDASRALW